MNRRQLVAGAGVTLLALSGCSRNGFFAETPQTAPIPNRRSYGLMYDSIWDGGFQIPAVDLKKVPRRYWRRQVDFETDYPVGTVIVNTRTFFLHLVEENGKAMRYGVGLGRQGFEWSGRGRIQWKQAWPKWTPPDEMIGRQPELEKWSVRNGGMPPGLDNPLGARALYIFQNGEDTLYRIHGSPEYWSIGKAVSSGCVRLMNQDIIDLYSRVPKGSTLIVV